MLSDDQHAINKRSELLNKCRHHEKYLLCKCNLSNRFGTYIGSISAKMRTANI